MSKTPKAMRHGIRVVSCTEYRNNFLYQQQKKSCFQEDFYTCDLSLTTVRQHLSSFVIDIYCLKIAGRECYAVVSLFFGH